MKAVFLAAIAMACFTFGSISNAAEVSLPIGEAHSTGALGPNTQQTVTVNSDGSIHAVLQDGIVTTTIDMQLSGNNVTIIKRNKWSMTTSMMDLATSTKFVDQNPAVAALIERGLSDLHALRAARYPTHTSVSSMAVGAPCAAEAQNMINAGYAAILACQSAGTLGCVVATHDYDKAVDAYNTCIKKAYPGAM